MMLYVIIVSHVRHGKMYKLNVFHLLFSFKPRDMNNICMIIDMCHRPRAPSMLWQQDISLKMARTASRILQDCKQELEDHDLHDQDHTLTTT